MFEEAVIYVLVFVITLPVVAIRLIYGISFDAGDTLCLLMIACSLVGLVRLARQRKSEPKARSLRGRDHDPIE